MRESSDAFINVFTKYLDNLNNMPSDLAIFDQSRLHDF